MGKQVSDDFWKIVMLQTKQESEKIRSMTMTGELYDPTAPDEDDRRPRRWPVEIPIDPTDSEAPAWQNGHDYVKGNMCKNGGIPYWCHEDHTASPSTEPPNDTYWYRLGVRIEALNAWKIGVYKLKLIGNITSS